MVKYYKCYRVFLSGTGRKLLVYLIYPLLVLGWCGLIAIGMGVESVHAQYALLITCGVLLWAEMLLDIFIYGGLLAKDSSKLEYLQTSHRGISVLKKSLCVDKLRRLVVCGGIFTAIYSVCHEQVSIGQLISLIFATVAVLEVGLLISRHFNSFNWVLVLATTANAVGILVGLLAVKLASVFAVLFLLLLVLAFLISSKVTMKRAERSFYDVDAQKLM